MMGQSQSQSQPMSVDAEVAVVTAEDAMSVDAVAAAVTVEVASTQHSTKNGKKKSKNSNWISYRHLENCPLELRLRLERAANRRLYLIDHPELPPDETTATVDYGTTSITLGILGSTGNVYTVALQVPSPTCTCPDHCQNRHFCKHILFVLLKVVGLNVADHPNLLSLPTGTSSTSTSPIDPNHRDASNVNYTYTPTDLQTVLAMLRERRRTMEGTSGPGRRKQRGYRMANRLVRAAVLTDAQAAQAAAATTTAAAAAETAVAVMAAAEADKSVEEEPKGVKRRRWQKDVSTTEASTASTSIDCPICFEDLTDAREDALTYCRSTCGANFHKECIGHWLQSQSTTTTGTMDQSEHKACLYCPNCRQEWWDNATLNDTDERPAKRGRHGEYDRNNDGNDDGNYNNYLNLAVQQGLHRKKRRKRKNRGRRHNY